MARVPIKISYPCVHMSHDLPRLQRIYQIQCPQCPELLGTGLRAEGRRTAAANVSPEQDVGKPLESLVSQILGRLNQHPVRQTRLLDKRKEEERPYIGLSARLSH